MTLWPDGDNKPKVLYVCRKHGRCGGANRARNDKGGFNLCRFCLIDDGKEQACRRIPVVPVSAVKDMLAINQVIGSQAEGQED